MVSRRPARDKACKTVMDSSFDSEMDDDRDKDYQFPSCEETESYSEEDCPEKSIPCSQTQDGETSAELQHEKNITEDFDNDGISNSGISASRGGVTVFETNNVRGKRTYDKWPYCLFCEKPQSKLPRHLTTAHPDEEKVIKWMLEKDDREKRNKLTFIRNLGNHQHNCEVLRSGQGSLIVGYRPNHPVPPEDYGPCSECYVYLVRTDLWKHKCPLKDNSTKEGTTHIILF